MNFKYEPDTNNPHKMRRTTDKEELEPRERGCNYVTSPETEEKIRRAATGFTEEKQTDVPGAKHGEEWLREHEIKEALFSLLEAVKEMLRKYKDIVGLQQDTRGMNIIDGKPYPTTEEMKKYIDEQCNKNVSQDYYKYGTILKRMDDTHTRKNSDYGDAAYKGYKKFGEYYFLVQLHNKLSRLESLTINGNTQMVKDESIDETLLDMANYAVMYLESRHRND